MRAARLGQGRQPPVDEVRGRLVLGVTVHHGDRREPAQGTLCLGDNGVTARSSGSRAQALQLAADPAIGVDLRRLGAGVGPPVRHRHYARLDQFQAVEERGELLRAA